MRRTTILPTNWLIVFGLAALVAATLFATGVFLRTATAATPRYVATTGDDAGPNDCLTEASPCLTIGHAIGQAPAGETNHVANGTYTDADRKVLSEKLSDPREAVITANLLLQQAGQKVQMFRGTNQTNPSETSAQAYARQGELAAVIRAPRYDKDVTCRAGVPERRGPHWCNRARTWGWKSVSCQA